MGAPALHGLGVVISDEQWQSIIRDKARRAVRPMILAMSKRGRLDSYSLNAVEAELRRQVHLASDGTLALDSMTKDRCAQAGLMRFSMKRTDKPRAGP